MLVKRNGIFKTIQPIEYGIYLKAGFVKVADGNIGDSTPKEEKEKREELPKLTLDEIHDTDKFVKLDEAKESVAAPHGESDVIPQLDEEGCYGGVCEVEEETMEETEEQEEQEVVEEKPKRNKRNNK